MTIKDDKVTSVEDHTSEMSFGDNPVSKQNNLVFINVEDEINIQCMHTLICARKEIGLNCCRTLHELNSFMVQVYSGHSWGTEERTLLVVMLDHILDGTNGIDV